jgi:hypothetical protein
MSQQAVGTTARELTGHTSLYAGRRVTTGRRHGGAEGLAATAPSSLIDSMTFGEPLSSSSYHAAGADLGIGVLGDQAGRPGFSLVEVTLARLVLCAASPVFTELIAAADVVVGETVMAKGLGG